MSWLSVWVCLFLAVAPEPIIVTAAGTGQAGYSGNGGPATKARLNQPFDVALNAQGDIYVSDTFNQRIRMIDHATGMISTIGGNGIKGFSGDGGPAVRAQLNEPYGVAIDPQGNLYFADRLNYRVRRIDAATGAITTVAGNGSNVYFGDGRPATNAGLVEPNGVALAPDGKTLFIADVAGHRVRRVDLGTRLMTTFAGTGRPHHDGDGGPAQQASIWGARAVDVGPDGYVYILEREGNRLRVVDPKTGIITTLAGTGTKGYTGDGGPAQSATFNGPKELAVDSKGNIWIVDTENHVIRKIDAATRHIQTVAGNGHPGGDGDGGPATRARLDRPHGVAVGLDGSCWIGDTNNHRVRLVGTAR
jgi:DNA-binding beta-propeller fold protein YncE